MSYRKHLSSARKFDSSAERSLERALHYGDGAAIHMLVSAGGKHENRRAQCRVVAARVLRKEGGFPLPVLEEQYSPPAPTDFYLGQVVTPSVVDAPPAIATEPEICHNISMTTGYDFWPTTSSTERTSGERLLTTPGAVRSAIAANLGSLLTSEELALAHLPAHSQEPFTPETE